MSDEKLFDDALYTAASVVATRSIVVTVDIESLTTPFSVDLGTLTPEVARLALGFAYEAVRLLAEPQVRITHNDKALIAPVAPREEEDHDDDE